jgi:hypothetical protein
MVKLIRRTTKDQLNNALRKASTKNVCIIATGTTRYAYIFETFVVKIDQTYADRSNKSEYAYYCRRASGDHSVPPIVFTRSYKTLDGHIILIQERLKSIIRDSSSEFFNYMSFEDACKIAPELDRWQHSDGMQAGKNRHGHYVYFDYNDR